ncbi:hypothetical protein JKP88DRAFT_157299, partial [Tribonema minus]
MTASGVAITTSAVSINYQTAALTCNEPPPDTGYIKYGTAVAVDDGSNYCVITGTRAAYGLSSAGGAYVLELDANGEWDMNAILVPTDVATSDNFGRCVAVSGTYAIVGSQCDVGGRLNAGAAYMFERIAGTWTQTTKLVASDVCPGDNFGIAVSVSGTYAIVGATTRYQLGVASSGGAYIFERNVTTGTWEQKATLFPSDVPTGAYFGGGICISGTYAIVGAYNKNTAAGGAYIFERNSTSGAWEEKAILAASDPAANMKFGKAVSIDGNYAVVAAEGKTVTALSNVGGAYVFERVSGTWGQVAMLDNPDPTASDYFGISVSVSGVYAVVGCYLNDPSSKSGAGSTYLFKRSSTTGLWPFVKEWTANDGLASDNMGGSVSIAGTHVVSGASFKTSAGVTIMGGAYMFE